MQKNFKNKTFEDGCNNKTYKTSEKLGNTKKNIK